MDRVLVPIRFPLTKHSTHTLSRAIGIAAERDAALTVLHVDLYQNGGRTDRSALERAVRETFGWLGDTSYVVRRGFRVEETILEEVVAEEADVVVVGYKQFGRWRRTLRWLRRFPDVAGFLRERIDRELVTVPPP